MTKFAGDRAAALREYGILGAERGAYAKGPGGFTATVYRLQDASGAYGVATFLRSSEMRDSDLGRHSAISRERAIALVGNLVLVVEQPGGNLFSAESDLRGLVGAIYPHAQQGLLPTVGEYLPAKGQVPGSRRYALGPIALNTLLPAAEGDWIGFSEGAEVELARYQAGDEDFTTLVASYPTPQVAAHRLEEVQRLFPERRMGQASIHSKRSASLVALVIGARDKTIADTLLGPIRYDAEITWNEPGFSASDPSVGEIVIGAIYGTGALLLLALSAGIGFGGVRLVLKYALPGKLFDRPTSVEIIQLGINSKPIEAKDFYSWKSGG